MKVAIIGGGIAGLMAADSLNGSADYTLFEVADKLGGHADTHEITLAGKTLHVDTGFLVYNEDRYHHFTDMLNRYEVANEASDMSFAVANRLTGLEYNATKLSTLFCQKKNLFNPKFYRMIFDIVRFYRQALKLLNEDIETGIYDYLTGHGYSEYFIYQHMMPMVSALWSGDFATVKDYPLHYLLKFMDNHQMLQLSQRPVWRTISGGSKNYVAAIQRHAQGDVKLNSTIQSVMRNDKVIEVVTDESALLFDAVIFATHADDTLRLLQNPTLGEAESFAAIQYVDNHMDLHTDARLLPVNKKAWASWSVNYYGEDQVGCQVNYYLNLLQNLPTETPVIVSLNQTGRIDPEQIVLSKIYRHPIYNQKTMVAQQQIQKLQGIHHSYYCGAYLGWGFHEDGARSGYQAAQRLKQDFKL